MVRILLQGAEHVESKRSLFDRLNVPFQQFSKTNFLPIFLKQAKNLHETVFGSLSIGAEEPTCQLASIVKTMKKNPGQ